MAYFVSELKSLEKDEVTGITSGAVPSPWFSPRMVESPHPVRDDFQFCKTVVLPGASCLYLKFDPRCATQYEYDKVRHGPEIPLLGSSSKGFYVKTVHSPLFFRKTVEIEDLR